MGKESQKSKEKEKQEEVFFYVVDSPGTPCCRLPLADSLPSPLDDPDAASGPLVAHRLCRRRSAASVKPDAGAAPAPFCHSSATIRRRSPPRRSPEFPFAGSAARASSPPSRFALCCSPLCRRPVRPHPLFSLRSAPATQPRHRTPVPISAAPAVGFDHRDHSPVTRRCCRAAPPPGV